MITHNYATAQDAEQAFYRAFERADLVEMMAVHSVVEHVTVAGDPRPANAVLATNIYLLTDRGWRLLVHHASALAPAAAPRETAPSVLH